MKRLSIKHILVTLLAMVGMIPPVVANNLPSNSVHFSYELWCKNFQ